jgi:hypothetical protein
MNGSLFTLLAHFDNLISAHNNVLIRFDPQLNMDKSKVLMFFFSSSDF